MSVMHMESLVPAKGGRKNQGPSQGSAVNSPQKLGGGGKKKITPGEGIGFKEKQKRGEEDRGHGHFCKCKGAKGTWSSTVAHERKRKDANTHPTWGKQADKVFMWTSQKLKPTKKGRKKKRKRHGSPTHNAPLTGVHKTEKLYRNGAANRSLRVAAASRI